MIGSNAEAGVVACHLRVNVNVNDHDKNGENWGLFQGVRSKAYSDMLTISAIF